MSSNDWKPIGGGKPTEPYCKAMKGRRWQIDWAGSGKSYDKITKPTQACKTLPYYDKVKEVVTPANPTKVDKDELKMGINVEKEHTTNNKEAAKIALTHLAEDPKYYSKLKKAHIKENTTMKYTDFFKKELNENCCSACNNVTGRCVCNSGNVGGNLTERVCDICGQNKPYNPKAKSAEDAHDEVDSDKFTPWMCDDCKGDEQNFDVV